MIIQIIQAFKMLDRMNENNQEKGEDKPCCNRYIISPNSKNKLYWDIGNNLFLIYSYFNVPFVIAFGMQQTINQNERKIELLLDVIILIDIALSFITDNYSEPGQRLSNLDIGWRYFRSFFLFDILSCVPGLLLLEYYSKDFWYYFKMLRYMQIPRTFSQIEMIMNRF